MKYWIFTCLFALSFSVTADLRPPQLDIVVKRNKSSSSKTDTRQVQGKNSEGEDYRSTKHTTESFEIAATIKSKEVRRSFKNLTADVYVFGEVVDSKDYILLDKVSKTFEMLPRKEVIVKTSPATLKSSKGEGGDKGSKYSGYAVVITDDNGTVVKTRATKSSFLKNLDEINKVEVGGKFRL